MSERSLVDYVLEGMKPYWRKAVKHADAFTAGIADLSGYLEPRGTVWIELKALDAWPKRDKTDVVFEFDDLQRDFILERKGWLFVRVGREYLLFNAKMAHRWVDRPGTGRWALMEFATAHWKNSVDWKEFSKWLKKRQ